MKIIECVPNFSVGRDRKKVERIAEDLLKAPGVKLLNYSSDADHNRSVFTLIGEPDALQDAAMDACGRAIELIDMRDQIGVHPRIGAVDVVPFIPLRGANMIDAVHLAHRFGREFAVKHGVPVYFYGEAAFDPARKVLSDIRRGGYEGLRSKMMDSHWQPDAGLAIFNENSGASCVGARKPLIAFNINLDTNDLAIAREIAFAVRESGGGLKCVQAMGVFLASRKIVQVSMNITDYHQTSLRMVFDTVKRKAEKKGTEILESELIGLAPRDAFADVTDDYLKLKDFSRRMILETYFD
jgi:glutamate formiminotransferase